MRLFLNSINLNKIILVVLTRLMIGFIIPREHTELCNLCVTFRTSCSTFNITENIYYGMAVG